MSEQGASVDVALVNWNTGPLLRGALAALGESDRRGISRLRAIVVDNDSSDDSLSDLPNEKLDIDVIRNQENRGFGSACNQAVSGSAADYLLFLNPDTVLEPASLCSVIEFMQRPGSQHIGICGLRLTGEQGEAMPSCGRYPSLGQELRDMTGLSSLLPDRFPPRIMREDEYSRDRGVEHVAGAFFLIRRRLFEQLGGFDERYFLYYEEIDLAKRARDSGWLSWMLSDVTAQHLGGRSTDRVKAARLFYLLRSRTQFVFKHQGRTRGTLHAALTATVELLSRLIFSLGPGSGTSTREVLDGYRHYIGYLISGGTAPSGPVPHIR